LRSSTSSAPAVSSKAAPPSAGGTVTAPSTAGGIGAEGSLLTDAALQACLRASDSRQLAILGLKIGIRPLDASLDERMAYLSSALSRLDASALAL
jgi:hypothetical protein